jgi:hypothetical protein
MMTLWDDIVGYTCLQCGKWATHWYGDIPICCACHISEPGSHEGDYMVQEAIEMNTKYQKGLPLSDEGGTPLIPYLQDQWGYGVDYTLDERDENDTVAE